MAAPTGMDWEWAKAHQGCAVEFVIGAGATPDLDPTWVEELLHRHPRQDFKQHMTTAMTNEAAAVPGGRTQWLIATTGFRQLIRRTPFPESGKPRLLQQ